MEITSLNQQACLGAGERRTRGFGVTSLPGVQQDSDSPLQCKWNGQASILQLLCAVLYIFLKAYFTDTDWHELHLNIHSSVFFIHQS